MKNAPSTIERASAAPGSSGAAIRRVLAIRPFGRGFGFAVLEGEDHLIDWGVRRSPVERPEAALRRLKALIASCAPDEVVLEDVGKGNRRSERARDFARDGAGLAERAGVPHRFVSRQSAKRALGGAGFTQYEFALLVVKRFPELAKSLPPKRKPWMPQDARYAIFEAAGMADAAMRTAPRAKED